MFNRQVHVRRPLGLIALAALAFLIAACGAAATGILSTVGSSIGDGSGGGAPAARPAPLTPVDPGNGQFGSTAAGGASTDQQAQYEISQSNLDIIKTGNLDLQVSGIDAALASATQKITALGGYASGSQRQGDGDTAAATVIYRIPATRWDDALVALRTIGIKVLGEQSQTQDVTGQIVDLGARITNLQATELALQSIMTKATKIADVLAVQQQLTDVRGQIEQASADRKHLQEQAAFSTLTVNYSLKEQAVAATTKKFDPNSEIDRASASLVDVLQGLATAGIWFAIVWLPILIALAIIGFIVAFVLRRILRVGRSQGSGRAGGELVPSGAPEG